MIVINDLKDLFAYMAKLYSKINSLTMINSELLDEVKNSPEQDCDYHFNNYDVKFTTEKVQNLIYITATITVFGVDGGEFEIVGCYDEKLLKVLYSLRLTDIDEDDILAADLEKRYLSAGKIVDQLMPINDDGTNLRFMQKWHQALANALD